MSEFTAAEAKAFLAAIPARPSGAVHRQTACLAGIMEQSVDVAFDALTADPPLGPGHAPNGSGSTQKGRYVFPWNSVPGDGYAATAPAG